MATKVHQIRTVGVFAGLCASVWTLPALGGVADTWVFTLNDKASTFHGDNSVTAGLPGSLIGNWDADTNPAGTMTRPGAAGGSGNHAIPYQSTLTAADEFDSRPVGTAVMELDIAGGAVALRSLDLDLINDISPVMQATLRLLFNTFHTRQPSSLYIGNIPLDLPLGEVTIVELIAAQIAGDAVGTLGQIGEDQYEFQVVAPMLLTLTIEYEAELIELDPMPLPMALIGVITLSETTAQAGFQASWSIDELNEGPFEGVGLQDVPIDVPTILPPGDTAHLLFSNQLEFVHLVSSGAIDAIADGVPAIAVEVVPAAFERLRGLAVGGDLASVFESDDDRLRTRPDVLRPTNVPPVQVLFTATSPILVPDQIEFVFEGRVTAPNILQRIRLYNVLTEQYELVDSRIGALDDETVVVTIGADAQRFVDPTTGETRALIQHIAVAFNVPPTWRSEVDLVRWRVFP